MILDFFMNPILTTLHAYDYLSFFIFVEFQNVRVRI